MQRVLVTLGINRRMPTLLTAALRIAVLGLPLAALSAQTLGRSVEIDPQHRSDAVTITRITLGETVLQCGIPDGPASHEPIVPLPAGSDWLSQLTCYLLNRTNKTIIYGSLELGFPETGDGTTPQTAMTTFPLSFGLMPPSVAFTGSGVPLRQENIPLDFEPGQTMAVQLDPKRYSEIQGDLARRMGNPAAITKLFVRRGTFIFSDSMKWNHGYWLPDPQRLGHWAPVADP